jgi:hypothetical protein
LRYQWLFNGGAIAGATSAKLILQNVTGANEGQYSVTLSNEISSITSGAVTLTVILPPTISNQPVSRSVGVGGLHTFTVAATGTTPLSYKWRKNGVEIAGATNSELPFAAVAVSDAGPYDVVVTNTGGTMTSSAAVLTVVPNPGAFSSRQFIPPLGASAFLALEGSQPKRLLLRAIGPALGAFGVTGTLPEPSLSSTRTARPSPATTIGIRHSPRCSRRPACFRFRREASTRRSTSRCRPDPIR